MGYNSVSTGVKALQAGMMCSGTLAWSPTDGVWGPKTDAALRAIQRASGITVDGVYGPQTHNGRAMLFYTNINGTLGGSCTNDYKV
jgi:peptidoglycan hydrolase-like protein with peptidoglycan-binding domain